jgi:predicted nuclease of predicted toxin-antitoxin system
VRFKIDENLPVELAEELRATGHEAATVDDQRLVGASDRHLSEVCKAEGRVFVTLDLEFADIRTYRTSIPDLSCCVSPGKTSLMFSTCFGER